MGLLDFVGRADREGEPEVGGELVALAVLEADDEVFGFRVLGVDDVAVGLVGIQAEHLLEERGRGGRVVDVQGAMGESLRDVAVAGEALRLPGRFPMMRADSAESRTAGFLAEDVLVALDLPVV